MLEGSLMSRTYPGSSTQRSSSCMATWPLSQKPYKQNEQDMWGTARETRTNSLAMFSNVLLDMDTPVLVEYGRLFYISAVQTLDVA